MYASQALYQPFGLTMFYRTIGGAITNRQQKDLPSRSVGREGHELIQGMFLFMLNRQFF